MAKSSGVAIATIKRMEGARGLPKTAVENLWKVQQALQAAGVIFIEENDEGPGVRFRKQRD